MIKVGFWHIGDWFTSIRNRWAKNSKALQILFSFITILSELWLLFNLLLKRNKNFWALGYCQNSQSNSSWIIAWVMTIDPRGRSKVTAGGSHYFCTCCPSVRPSQLFKISQNKKLSNENSDCYWRDCRSGRVDHWWMSCDYY